MALIRAGGSGRHGWGGSSGTTQHFCVWYISTQEYVETDGRPTTTNVPLTSFATLQKSGLWGSGISTFARNKHCSEHQREEMSHWRYAEILDIGRDMAIHCGAQLIGINDCRTF